MVASWFSVLLVAAVSTASAAYTSGCKAPAAPGCQPGKAVYLKPGVCVATCPLGKCAAGYTNKMVPKTYTKPAYLTACTACAKTPVPGCSVAASVFTTVGSCARSCSRGGCMLNYRPVNPAAQFTACASCGPVVLPTNCATAVRRTPGVCTSTCTGCKAGFNLVNGVCQAESCGPLPPKPTGCSDWAFRGSCTATCTACGAGFNLVNGVCQAVGPIDPCNPNPCPATATCNSGVCTCKAGYGGADCSNINECTTTGHNCDSNAVCTDNTGSFTCACRQPEYQGAGTIGTCVLVKQPVDECTTKAHNCDGNATCTDSTSSFSCACNKGYVGTGTVGTCTAIVPCINTAHNCNQFATCTAVAGSYSCSCNAGWAGDGITCNDVDQCVAKTHDCATTATCTNVVGGNWTCACNTGYTGDGKTCTACTGTVDNCQATFIKYPNSPSNCNNPTCTAGKCVVGYTNKGADGPCTICTPFQCQAGQMFSDDINPVGTCTGAVCKVDKCNSGYGTVATTKLGAQCVACQSVPNCPQDSIVPATVGKCSVAPTDPADKCKANKCNAGYTNNAVDGLCTACPGAANCKNVTSPTTAGTCTGVTCKLGYCNDTYKNQNSDFDSDCGKVS